MSEQNSKQIGSMNGRWAFLMKIFLSTWPFVLGLVAAWAIWVTTEAFKNKAFREAGDRFTYSMGVELENRVTKSLYQEMKTMNANIEANSKKLTRIEAFWEKEHGIIK